MSLFYGTLRHIRQSEQFVPIFIYPWINCETSEIRDIGPKYLIFSQLTEKFSFQVFMRHLAT